MSAEAYHHLLYKRLLEGLSTNEERLLNAWLSESDEHRRTAAEVEAIFRASAAEAPPVDVPTELAAFKTRLRQAEAEQSPQPELRVTHRSPLRWAWAAAAALALLVGATFFFQKTPQPAEAWVAVSSETNQNQLVALPDGSRAWLNSHSTLRFARSFEGLAERNVQLEGEAFFEVEKDSAHPFVVEAGPCKVRVLGTSFNVRALPDEPTCDVEVRTGRVRVSAPASATVLAAGQRAVYDKPSQKLSPSTQDPAQVADWRSPEISFQKIPLREAAQRLSRRFGQKIEVENAALAGCPYSGYFPRADLGAVLTNLEAVFHVSVEKTSEGYLLRGGRCP